MLQDNMELYYLISIGDSDNSLNLDFSVLIYKSVQPNLLMLKVRFYQSSKDTVPGKQ